MLLKANAHMYNQMSSSEEKAWLHFLSGDPMFRNFVQSQSTFGVDPKGQIARQPICSRCERPCFHHEKGIACNHCGYTGPKSVKAIQYLRDGLYKS